MKIYKMFLFFILKHYQQKTNNIETEKQINYTIKHKTFFPSKQNTAQI